MCKVQSTNAGQIVCMDAMAHTFFEDRHLSLVGQKAQSVLIEEAREVLDCCWVLSAPRSLDSFSEAIVTSVIAKTRASTSVSVGFDLNPESSVSCDAKLKLPWFWREIVSHPHS